jgi:hypothetical protein
MQRANAWVKLLDSAYYGESWHGPSLQETVEGVGLKTAVFRAGASRKNIWEQVLHAAYWKHVAWGTLALRKEEPFAAGGKNWLKRPAAGRDDAEAWKKDLELLEAMHVRLRNTVSKLSARGVAKALGPEWLTPEVLIRGVAMHDVYHAGQIQLLKRLAKAK